MSAAASLSAAKRRRGHAIQESHGEGNRSENRSETRGKERMRLPNVWNVLTRHDKMVSEQQATLEETRARLQELAVVVAKVEKAHTDKLAQLERADKVRQAEAAGARTAAQRKLHAERRARLAASARPAKLLARASARGPGTPALGAEASEPLAEEEVAAVGLLEAEQDIVLEEEHESTIADAEPTPHLEVTPDFHHRSPEAGRGSKKGNILNS